MSLQQLTRFQGNEGQWIYDAFKIDDEVYLLDLSSKHGYLVHKDCCEKKCPDNGSENAPLPIVFNGKEIETFDEVMQFIEGDSHWDFDDDYVYCTICEDYQKFSSVSECSHVFFNPKGFLDGCGSDEAKFRPKMFKKLAKSMKHDLIQFIALLKNGGEFVGTGLIRNEDHTQEIDIPQSDYAQKNYAALMWLKGADDKCKQKILKILENYNDLD